MSRLRDNLHKMSRVELNNLAKNKWCDNDIQVWLAKHAHIQARYYLADNTMICDEATTVLLNGRSGIVKGMLCGSGNIRDEDTIREIYKNLKHKLSPWRLQAFFVSNLWKRDHVTQTPSDVLDDIVSTVISKSRSLDPVRFGSPYLLESVARHKNCSTKSAIMMSQFEQNSRIQKAGFDALVRLGNQTS